jgi:predicted lipoprotein with Yx(FWY)xxD motif
VSHTYMRALAIVPALGLALAACGSSGGSGSSTNGSSTTTSGATVSVKSTSLGKVLVDAEGHTLYTLTKGGSDVACTGSCASIWTPSLESSGAAQAGSGVSATVGTVARGSDKQVTVGDHPVYTYTGDGGPGQTSGQGVQSFGGIWYVLDAAGMPVTGSMASSSPPGYSY